MLKATLKVRDNLSFEIETKEQRDLFEQIASLLEVFGVKTCGLCKKSDLKFIIRKNKDEDLFYEMVCLSCGAKLAFSVNKKGGTLYPVIRLKDGLPAKVTDEAPFDYTTKGWHKWEKDKHGVNKKS
jgi:hypothetical protein